jgi:hypothetical protein
LSKGNSVNAILIEYLARPQIGRIGVSQVDSNENLPSGANVGSNLPLQYCKRSPVHAAQLREEVVGNRGASQKPADDVPGIITRLRLQGLDKGPGSRISYGSRIQVSG